MKCLVLLALCCLAAGATEQINRLTSASLVASPTFYPYQVSIQLDGSHFCGGSIIGKKHVLTAAHCMYPHVISQTDRNRLKIVVGTTFTNTGTKYDVSRVSCHGSYVQSDASPSLVADVSVITLTTEIVETDSVRIIGLPQPMAEYNENTSVIVTGYGTDRLYGPNSPALKHLFMYLVSRDVCQQYWPNMQISTGLMCGYMGVGYGVCNGDSGGPVVLEDKSTVIGIISATSTTGCGTGRPDLFTKVSYYMDYIRSEMAMTI